MQSYDPKPKHFSSDLLRQIIVHDHLCQFYSTLEEQAYGVACLIRSAVQQKSACVLQMSQDKLKTIYPHLSEYGLNAEDLERDGLLKFEVEAWADGATTDPVTIHQTLDRWLAEAKDHGFKKLWICADVGVLAVSGDMDRLMEYERSVHSWLLEHEGALLDMYPSSGISADILLDLLHIHPRLIALEEICDNPCFLPPSIFLADESTSHGLQNLLRTIATHKREEEHHRQINHRMLEVQNLLSLGMLAGRLAHDFNNLLVGILGSAGLALHTLSTSSPAKPHLLQIEEAATQAAELTKQLMAWSGKGISTMKCFDLSQMVQEMKGLMIRAMRDGIQLRLNAADSLPSIEADAGQIRQVLMNLVSNASDAIQENEGIVTITTGVMECDNLFLKECASGEEVSPGTYVYVEVIDTGKGMDEKVMAKIFDPFFSTKHVGRGLGLAAVKGITREHKGILKVTSEPGQGTTFRLFLPTEASVIDALDEKQTVNGKTGPVVMVVDDEEIVRNVVTRMLESFGYQVIAASSGNEALVIYQAHSSDIDMILLDMIMPHLSGEEVLNRMLEINPKARIVLSSGYKRGENINPDLRKRIAGFIDKPYMPDQLKSILEKAQTA